MCDFSLLSMSVKGPICAGGHHEEGVYRAGGQPPVTEYSVTYMDLPYTETGTGRAGAGFDWHIKYGCRETPSGTPQAVLTATLT